MCGRYVLVKKTEELREYLGADEPVQVSGKTENYNVSPTDVMPVAYTTEHGNRKIEYFHWGFMGWKPKSGAKPFLPINTRDDSVASKPMWKGAVTKNRCIVPANGFYEWSGKKGNKTPYYIYLSNEKYMGFAGIFSDLAPEESGAKKSYSIITTSPNSMMENIHDRMPVILRPEEFDDWLNPDHTDPDYLMDFLRPYPDDAMAHHIVSKAVGNVRNNYPGLIRKADLFG